jgi:L-ascorbate metabolism protein UlaG (beta-lactamase superfamily)
VAERTIVDRADHADASASFLGVGPFDRNRALWGGFMLAPPEGRIFFAGDTAYAPFFQSIRKRLGPIDVALLPIGAYEPRWFMQSVHMNPAEAVQARSRCLTRASACISARSS